MPANAAIKIYRSDHRWATLSSWYYKVLIDGVQAGELWNRQVKVFEVKPGVHEVRIKRWPSFRSNSLKLTMEESQTVELACPFWAGIPTLFGLPRIRLANEKDKVRMRTLVENPVTPRNLGEELNP